MEGQTTPHAVCIPSPAQGHICAMLKLAKLLHHKGFHITYVLTQLNYTHIMQARDFLPLNQTPTFRFETIADGIPPRQNRHTAIDFTELCFSTAKNCYAPFRELVDRLNLAPDVPPVSCIVSDAFMSFTVRAAEELSIPIALFWPVSGVVTMLHLHSPNLRDKVSRNKGMKMPGVELEEVAHQNLEPVRCTGLVGTDYIIDWIPGIKSIALGDIPTTAWSPDPNDSLIDYTISQVSGSYKASAVIFHTFDELEPEVCDALCSMFNRAYTIGPIPLLLKGFPESEINKIECHMWREDPNCIQWLDSKPSKSVVYVNFGSMAITTPEKMIELAMGLCKSMQNFLWIIRSELLSSDWFATLPPEFMNAVKTRGENVGRVVRELMEGDKGREVKKKATFWKERAEVATSVGGSSFSNLDKLIREVLLCDGQYNLKHV
nr:7-deoxyloganetin glucosyltransferase-like [Ipomoea batatas]